MEEIGDGRDFAPANGDILTGTFTDIGSFIVNAGETIYAGSSLLALFANDVSISGTIYGGVSTSPTLDLTSQSNIVITSTGILDQWATINLTAQNAITLSGTVDLDGGSVILPSNPIVSPPGATISIGGGDIVIDPVPVPPALLLLGSGLVGLIDIRKRLGR